VSATVRLVFTLTRAELVSANDREHFQARGKRMAHLRRAAALRAAAEVPDVVLDGRVDVDVLVRWPDNRRRDAPNIAPTAKALVDGIVDAGVLEDDADRIVRRTSFEAVGTDAAGGMFDVVLVLRPAAPAVDVEALLAFLDRRADDAEAGSLPVAATLDGLAARIRRGEFVATVCDVATRRICDPEG
jgi:Holliday junction resolvase RusA-like endonuclease